MSNKKLSPNSKYKPEYCQKVKDLMAQGYTVARCALAWDIGRKTYYRWRLAHAEFMEATITAQDYAQAWYDKEEVDNLGNRNYNALLHIHFGRRRFHIPETRNVEIKGFADAEDFKKQARLVRRAVQDGDCTPAEAKHLFDTILVQAKIMELIEIKERLDKIEMLLGAKIQ